MARYESETSYNEIILHHKWTAPNIALYKNCASFWGNKFNIPNYGYWFQLELRLHHHSSQGVIAVHCGQERTNFALYIVDMNIAGKNYPAVGGIIPNTVEVIIALGSAKNIKIDCYITIKVRKEPSSLQLVKVPERQLSQHIGALFNTDEYADVTIVTADLCEIPAHKIILSARSKVFAAMLKHPMEESLTNRVIIDDFSDNVVQELLRFIYTEVAPSMDHDMAKDLLAAADKYDVQRLQTLCLQYLFDLLSIETAAMTLNLAHKYNEKALLSNTAKYIKRNSEAVKGTEGWQSIVEMIPVLLIETFLELNLDDI